LTTLHSWSAPFTGIASLTNSLRRTDLDRPRSQGDPATADSGPASDLGVDGLDPEATDTQM
jgi:hypothetical protein